jgi:DNA-binding XRE family transcriptional regulator
VLVGLFREEVAERAGLCRHSIRKWETSSDAVPAATCSHLCRAVDVLENEGARFSGDIIRRLTRLSNGSGTPSINSNDSKGYISLLGPVTPAYPTRGMSRSPGLLVRR